VKPELLLATISACAWLYLLMGRGGFWRGWREPPAPSTKQFPAVVAIVPARNEAACIGGALQSLFAQDYPGSLSVIVVDDHSSDATAEIARRAAAHAVDRLTVVDAPRLLPGWTGKLWAMQAGLERAASLFPDAPYILFADADIEHGPQAIRRLVSRAEAGALDLVSLMVRLRLISLAERALVPAFVFFFRMLYPFAWVNSAASPVAAAAGGCMLVRRAALAGIGGLAAIRGALIDDCALAQAIKSGGRIRLDVAETSRSVRAYAGFGDIWRLIARTAYAELRYSPLRLVVAIAGMAIVFEAPPLLALFGTGIAQWLGIVAWAAMAIAFLPCLAYHGASIIWAPGLPLVALFYLAATLDSARRHALGVGGEWKGRVRGGAVGHGEH
jgi:hopene-associated glycosyltransferase HpnB